MTVADATVFDQPAAGVHRMNIVRKTGALAAAGSATVAVGIVPAAVASTGENGRRAWLDFFAAQIRNREHTPGLRARRTPAVRLAFADIWNPRRRRHRAGPYRGVAGGTHARGFAPDGQAGAGRDTAALRLADGSPGCFVVAGGRSARSEAHRSPRDDAGSFRRRMPPFPALRPGGDNRRSSRPSLNCNHDVQLRAGLSCACHEREGRLHDRRPSLAAPA